MLKPHHHRQAGFSLVELAVVLLMIGILVSLALPPITEWIAVSRLRAVAETLQHAARLAQAESLRRSRSAALVLTSASNPTIGATPADNGSRWWVQSLMRSGEDAAAQRMLQNGTEPVSLNVTVSGPAALCFNALGQQATLTSEANGLGVACTTPSATTNYITNYTFTHPRTTRSMRLQIGLGGEIRMCNPDKVLSDEAPDGCR